MATIPVARPLWRRFTPRFLDRAAAHVRRGGHAAVVVGEGAAPRVDMFFPLSTEGRLAEMGLWSLLAIEQRRWRRVRGGEADGLATARVTKTFTPVVLDWCERDAVHPGTRRTMPLDCLDCAACCRDADVVLDAKDLARWRLAGREDLSGREDLRRSRDGKIRLRFLDDGRCRHLARDRRCRIYELRPANCSVFPAGSEACLAAREDTLGLRDG